MHFLCNTHVDVHIISILFINLTIDIHINKEKILLENSWQKRSSTFSIVKPIHILHYT